MSESDQTLCRVALMADLSPDELKAVDQSCRWKRYSAHEQIIDSQDDSRDVLFLIKGRVRVVNYSHSGREVAFDDLPEGSFFGELAALDGQPRSAGVMALTDSLIAALPYERFLETLDRHPSIARKVMAHLARVVRTSNDRIMDLSTVAANNRVQAELLRRARPDAKDGNVAMIKPIPVHGDIASRVSTTRETVARVLNDLARQGIVERRKDSLIIHDLMSLRHMVEEVRGE